MLSCINKKLIIKKTKYCREFYNTTMYIKNNYSIQILLMTKTSFKVNNLNIYPLKHHWTSNDHQLEYSLMPTKIKKTNIT